jgi:hypothetical protein
MREIFRKAANKLCNTQSILFIVSYPEKGECADPVNEDAILGEEGGGASPRAEIRSIS